MLGSSNRYARRIWQLVALAGIGLLVAGCHRHQPLGPPIPTGATILGGQDMTSAPPPPPGWTQHTAVPTSQLQAQDTVLAYLKKTLEALPPGTTIDASRYGGAGDTVPCGDAPLNTHPPVEFTVMADLKPPDDNYDIVIAAAGEAWKNWGWWVFERDDFHKPSRFGYAPDGYSLQIKTRPPLGFR